MAIDKLGLYNNALIQVGGTVLDSLSDSRDERTTLDAIYDLGAIDYCLEVVKPKFATKTVALTGAATSGGVTLAYTFTLPSDFVTIVGVYSDSELDQEVNRYIQDGSTILCDYDTIYLRYTHNAVTESDFTQGFARVVAGYLAREICNKLNKPLYDAVDENLQKLVESVIATEGEKEPGSRPAAEGSPLNDAWRSVYNDALLIVGEEKLAAGDTDSIARVKLDTAVAAGAVVEVLEDTEWKFGVTSVKIDYDTSVSPSWGYSYACQKPADLQRIVGVFADEYFKHPIKDYVDEGDYFYSAYQTIYLKYVDASFVNAVSAWPTYFSRLVAAKLAKDVAPGLAPNLLTHAINTYEKRRDSAMSNDAIQSPPLVIAGGDWVASRGGYGRGQYGRGRP